MILNNGQNNALLTLNEFMESNENRIILSGGAGTGKTTFLKQIVANTYKNTVVAAPTGIAAINAGGVTLHSFFHLPFGTFLPNDVPISLLDYNQKFNTPKSLISGQKLNSTKRQLIREEKTP